MSYENIIVETKGKVGIVRLNRPHALNALNAALIGELCPAIDAFEADANIACVVLTGSDKQVVGQVAANMRALRPPDPYKNKGVRFTGESLRKKVGKTGGAGAK